MLAIGCMAPETSFEGPQGREAPDEGAIQAEAAGDRVRLLTIHGAKGLEAPVSPARPRCA